MLKGAVRMRVRAFSVAVGVALAMASMLPPSAGAGTGAQETATKLREPDVIYVPTPQEVVDAMLVMARVTSKDVVYDLGSGDGRIPIAAAQKYGVRAVG